jgi:hypothetical protein
MFPNWRKSSRPSLCAGETWAKPNNTTFTLKNKTINRIFFIFKRNKGAESYRTPTASSLPPPDKAPTRLGTNKNNQKNLFIFMPLKRSLKKLFKKAPSSTAATPYTACPDT